MLQKIVMANIKVFEFTVAVPGYLHYRKFWKPEHQQVLNCYHEKNNALDRFAIMVCETGYHEKPVGHLPMKISRAIKFFIDQGATLTAELTSDHYRRSPLILGGMEIPCKITAKISGTAINLLLMEKYIQLVKELYTEPKDEEILGSFCMWRLLVWMYLFHSQEMRLCGKGEKSQLMFKWKTSEVFNRNQTQRSNQNHPSSKNVTTEKILILD